MRMTIKYIWACSLDVVIIASTSSQCSDEPAHSHSLVRAFTAQENKDGT